MLTDVRAASKEQGLMVDGYWLTDRCLDAGDAWDAWSAMRSTRRA
jgi:hypothetical protein